MVRSSGKSKIKQVETREAQVRDILVGARKIAKQKVRAAQFLKAIQALPAAEEDLEARKKKIRMLKARYEAGLLSYDSEEQRKKVAKAILRELA